MNGYAMLEDVGPGGSSSGQVRTCYVWLGPVR
jgi:hypothetical protein